MPYYDFKCRGCQGTFEENVPMAQQVPPVCPVCGSADTEKLFTGCAVSGVSENGCGRNGFT